MFDELMIYFCINYVWLRIWKCYSIGKWNGSDVYDCINVLDLFYVGFVLLIDLIFCFIS